MGHRIFVLLFYTIRIFNAVGEATIITWNLLLRLIVSFVNGVTGTSKFLFPRLSLLKKRVRFISSNIHRSFATASLFFKKFSKKLDLHLSSAFPRFPIPRVTLGIPKSGAAFILGFIVALFVFAIPGGLLFITQDLPNPQMLTSRDIPVTTKIYDRNGELLYEVYADQNRTPIPLLEIPDLFKKATIAIEDKDFYHHNGYSLSGIARALFSIVVKNEIQGGSTITQQLVRSALLNHAQTVQRKIKELVLSVWTEHLYSKEEILEMYFTQVPYGGTAWGAEAAAQTYFGKSIREVNLGEAALLAGLPAAPTRFSPFGSHPELAQDRQKEVLRRMVEDGYITPEERQNAENEALTYKRPAVSLNAPHFVMYVKELLSQEYGLRRVEQGGLRVTTSLDLSLQNKIQEIVKTEVANLERLNVGNGATVVADPHTGQILSLVGSTDYFDSSKQGNVNVALTPQQPGSTIKVVTYSAALQNGFTAATLLSDSPITYQVAGSPSYSPVNYDGRFHGSVPLRYALGNSYNVPAVRTLAKIGVPTMMEQGKNMGITSWSDPSQYGLSLTLGGGEVTMLEMTSVYATLANGGKRAELTPILEVKDYLGNVLEENKIPETTQVVPEEIAFIISDILSDNSARTSSFGTNSALTIPGQWVPVKTGTSDKKRDNWTIGYTQDFVVTTWVGNMDNSPMHPTLTSGITGATPIWRKVTDLMLSYYPSKTPLPPNSIVIASCRGRSEYFLRGTETNACAPIPEKKDDVANDENKRELFSVQAEEPEEIIIPRDTNETLEKIKKEIEKRRKRRT